MKNIIIVLLVLSQSVLFGQTMTWIPSKYIVNKGCSDMTDCDENIICYKLQYTPSVSGELTSYTTGFIADCEDGETKVKINQSCLIEDKSDQTEACETFGKILLNCSGNSGTIQVQKDRPIILHQICLDAKNKNIEIVESDITKLTTSLDREGGRPITEFAKYKNYMALSSSVFCPTNVANLELNAHLDDRGNVLLEWEPAREEIEGSYILQRSFNEGLFEDIYSSDTEVIAALSQGKYTYIDENVDYGAFRYRVVYEVGNEEATYSNVADVWYKNQNHSMILYPNPARDMVTILVTAPSDQVNVTITDAAGNLAARKTLKTDIEQVLDLSEMVPGVYSITLFNNEKTISKKLIIVD